MHAKHALCYHALEQLKSQALSKIFYLLAELRLGDLHCSAKINKKFSLCLWEIKRDSRGAKLGEVWEAVPSGYSAVYHSSNSDHCQTSVLELRDLHSLSLLFVLTPKI